MEHRERGFRRKSMSGPKLLALFALTCGMHLMAQPPTKAMESRIFEIGAQRIDAEVVVGAGHDSSLFRSYPELISVKFELPPGEK